jgi:hypothetical protein
MGIQGIADERSFPEENKRPSAQRVAARALVLSTIVCRGYLEKEHREGDSSHAEGHRGLHIWLQIADLWSELEPEELQLLRTPPGQASDRAMIDALWRTEGLGVLAWTLGRFELPPYDEMTNPDAAQKAVGFLRPAEAMDLSESGVLRPDPEIGRLSTHLTTVHWRLRQFRIGRDSPVFRQATEDFGAGRSGIGEPMDFVGLLRRYPHFKERWLEDLRLIDGDLAIGGTPIAEAAPEAVVQCGSIAMERQIAAYWLEGDDEVYSRVNTPTLLSACVE